MSLKVADFVVKVAGEPDADRMSTIFVLLRSKRRHRRPQTDDLELKKDFYELNTNT